MDSKWFVKFVMHVLVMGIEEYGKTNMKEIEDIRRDNKQLTKQVSNMLNQFRNKGAV